jgi:hypothetical protein
MDNTPVGYESGRVPGVFVSATIYPLALGASSRRRKKPGFAESLGVSFLYDKVLSIETNVQNAVGEMATLPTNQVRFGVGGAYRLLLGKSQSSPSVEVKVGYTKSKFIIKRAMIPAGVELDVPDTKYNWVDPGLRLRMPITKELAIHAEGRFLLVLSTGPMQNPGQYGAAKVTGGDANVGLEYWVSSRYLVRAGARYTRLGFDFEGNGVKNDRDGDGQTDVGGALDLYVGAYLNIGAAF